MYTKIASQKIGTVRKLPPFFNISCHISINVFNSHFLHIRFSFKVNQNYSSKLLHFFFKYTLKLKCMFFICLCERITTGCLPGCTSAGFLNKIRNRRAKREEKYQYCLSHKNLHLIRKS